MRNGLDFIPPSDLEMVQEIVDLAKLLNVKVKQLDQFYPQMGNHLRYQYPQVTSAIDHLTFTLWPLNAFLEDKRKMQYQSYETREMQAIQYDRKVHDLSVRVKRELGG